MHFQRSILLLLVLFIGLFQTPLQAFQQPESSKDTTRLSLDEAYLNKGNEQDVFGLISGLYPGLIVSKPGADPNQTHDALVRGAGTIMGPQSPLVVIDGMIGAPLSLIDLNDIASIKLLKGYETAKYGMQGGNGVLEITTKGFTSEKMVVSVKQSLFADSRIYKDKLLGRDGFLALGGNDLGSNTTWVDEITATSVSSLSHVNVKGATGPIQYNVSGNVRLVNGILKESGFDQYNLLGRLKWSLSESLSLSYSGSFTERDAQLGFGEAFKQAYRMNPTQPVRFESGALYQAIFFDYYNPVGFIEYARKTSESSLFSQQLGLEKNFEGSTLNVMANYFNNTSNYNEDFSPLFFYNYNNNAYRASANSLEQLNFGASYSINQQQLGVFEVSEVFSAGYLSRHTELLERSVFNGALIEAEDADDFDLYHFDATVNASIPNVLTAEVYLRYENSSTLGANQQSAIFPSIALDLELGSIFPSWKNFKLSGSYGMAGLTLYDEDYNSDAANAPLGLNLINPDLTFEKSLNSDIGLTFLSPDKSISMSAVRFSRNVKDIMGGGVSAGFLGEAPPEMLLNNSELKNTGWELMGSYIHSWTDKSFRSTISFSTLTTEWVDFPYSGLETSFLTYRNDQPLLFQEGEPYGALIGYPSVTSNGQNVFLDFNGDGDIDMDDKATLGQALPQMWLGWRNEFRIGKTSISFLMEGVFGHYMVNSANFERGINDIEGGNLNVLEDRYSFYNTQNFLSSPFVENADYIRLRYLSVEHQLTLGGYDLQIFGVMNNLFTLSNFRGNDPSARLSDQIVDFYYFNRLGIQRTHEWLPSRSFMIGVKASF